MSGRSYISTIFDVASQVDDAPASPTLFVGGFSLVPYFTLRLQHGALNKAVKDRKVDILSDGNSYREKMKADSSLVTTTLLPAGTLPGGIAGQVGAARMPIRQSLMWLADEDEYALAVVPLVFSAEKDGPFECIEINRPLGVEGLLAVIKALIYPGTLRELSDNVTEHLNAILGPQQIDHTEAVDNALGVQLWDLVGLESRSYQGVEDSRRYAWELSALMAHQADHVLSDGLWNQRSKELIFSEMREGFSVLKDHMVFVNASCCLEVSNLLAGLRSRSESRMNSYGYDSSSIFVWTTLALRHGVVKDLTKRYHTEMKTLPDRGARDQARLAEMQARHYSLIETLSGFRESLREDRNRVFDERACSARLYEQDTLHCARHMEETRVVSSLVKTRDEVLQSRTNFILGDARRRTRRLRNSQLGGHIRDLDDRT